MELKYNSDGIPCKTECWSGILQQSEAQESVVPDVMPDIARVLCSCGFPLIRSKDVAAQHVRVEANVPVRVVYADEDDGIFCMDVNIPFYFSAQDDAIEEGAFCAVALTLRQLDTRILNPRKISVSAQLKAELRCWKDGMIETCGADGIEQASVYVSEKTCEVFSASDTAEQTFILTDAFTLPPGSPAAAELLAQRAEVLLQEQKPSGGKLFLRGSVRSTLLYRTMDGAIAQAQFLTPFSQLTDGEYADDAAIAEQSILLSGVYYEILTETDGRRIEAEMHLVSQVAVMNRSTLRYIEDAYSNAYALELQRDTLEVVTRCTEQQLRDTCIATVETAASVGSIIACDAVCADARTGAEGISMELRLSICYESNGKRYGVSRTVPFQIRSECADRERLALTQIALQEISAVPVPGGAEVRIPVEARVWKARSEKLERVCAVTCDEASPLSLGEQPSLIIRKPLPGERLWDIAKENCSTQAAICAANGLSPDEAPPERLLLIPKAI